ncbi:hypothetical protein D3C72_1409030 [compost metagenome]
MQQHLLLQYGLAEIEHRQRQGQEDDGAEGAEPVLLGAAQQQIELLEAMPDQGSHDEKQRQAQDHVDGPEPGDGAAPLPVPHQPGDQLVQIDLELAAMALHLQSQLPLRGRNGGQDPRSCLALAQALHAQHEGIGLEGLLGEGEQPQQQGGQLGFVLLIAPQHIDGAHLCHMDLGQVGS